MYTSEEILREFERIQEDSPLPRKGPMSVFYDTFIDRENSLLLESGGSYHVFYFNSHDTIESITDDAPGFIFEKKGALLLCLIIFNPGGDQITSYLPFDLKDDTHVAFLHALKRSRTIQLHFITMLYGDLHRMKSLTLEVPELVLKDIEPR
jgi:hypothetical protein